MSVSSLSVPLSSGQRARWGLALIALLFCAMAMSQNLVQVLVAKVQVTAVGNGFELDGVIQPVKQATVAAQTSGRVVAMAVKAGDKVRSGQLLASIDDSETQTGLQRSQAQVAQAQAQWRNAQSNFDRTRDLLRQGFVSSAAMDSADAQLKSAAAARDQALAESKQANLNQGFTRVTAPFDAWVQQTMAEAGDLAMPGKSLLMLYAPLPLRAVVQIPVSRVSQMGASSQIEVQVPTPDGQQQWIRPLQTTRVPSADAVSQTIEWRLDLPAPTSQGLLPGQQIRVRFAAGSKNRLTVPAAAVLRRGELTAVYVAAGQGFVLRAVRLGSDHGAQGFEVLAGLSAQDSVALDPVKAGLAGAQPSAAAAQ